MNGIQQFFFNLIRGPQEKDNLVWELRREIDALKERNMELRTGEWFVKYLDAVEERDRAKGKHNKWKDIAWKFYNHSGHLPTCPPSDDDECTCGFSDAVYDFEKAWDDEQTKS